MWSQKYYFYFYIYNVRGGKSQNKKINCEEKEKHKIKEENWYIE